MATEESDLTPRCGNCKFAVSTHEGIECRRYAPSPLDLNEGWVWPLVIESDWCGEYKMNALDLPFPFHALMLQ